MNEERSTLPVPTVEGAPAAEQQSNSAVAGGKYGVGEVEIFQNADHIRQRPGMYIGDTGTDGLHHLVYELVYNSVDEALAGYCQNIIVKIKLDGSMSVSDD